MAEREAMRRRSRIDWRPIAAMLVFVGGTTPSQASDDNTFDPTRPVVAIETVRAMMDERARNERAATATFNADAGKALAASRASSPTLASGPAAAGLARTLNPGVDPDVAIAVARADEAHRAATDRNGVPFAERDGDIAVARVGRKVDKRGQPVLSTVILVPALDNWVNVVAPGHSAYGRAVSWETAMQQLRDFNARYGIQHDRPPPSAAGGHYIGEPTNVVTQPPPERVPDGVQVDPLTGERFDSRTGKTLPGLQR